MSAGVSITVHAESLDQAVKDVERLKGAAGGQQVRSEMGFAIMQTVRRHFSQIAQDAEHHESAQSLGADRTGYYERARAGTQEPVIEGEGVSVSVALAGIAQRYFGGVVHARPNSFLTIPALAIAYGKRAREFDLRLIIFGDTGLAALVSKSVAKPSEGEVYYWLVRSVTQKGDPTILPTDEEMVDAAKQNALAYIDQVWGRS